MARCLKAGIDAPCVYFVDLEARKIFMEYVEGCTIKEVVQQSKLGWRKVLVTRIEPQIIATKIATLLSKLHDANIVHGDLTTSNILIRAPIADDSHLVFISKLIL
jgi:TP53 regulating kinase-like protein